jgi:hypothetical protein
MRIALALLLLASAAAAGDYFVIRVVDADSGRGVPLVELKTTSGARWFTDSNGIVAFREPGWMGQRVFFHVRSHGYEFPKDGFGFRGTALTPVAGERAELKIRRINVAERLCRLTGSGIYRDSRLAGLPVPRDVPSLRGRVVGQDSVVVARYGGKLHWFWGDTNRPAYPLGNFGASGATTPLDLDPEQGFPYDYFVDESGFSRRMCAVPGPGATWLSGLMVVEGRLVAYFVRVKDLGTRYEHGLVMFDDEKQVFEPLVRFDLEKVKLHPHGHPVRVRHGKREWFYFGNPFPNVRVPATLAAVKDPAAYEAYTKDDWVRGGEPLDPGAHLRDVDTGKPVKPHNGSVYWNDYRKRWVAIVNEAGGTSYLGEVWFATADTILGPWVYARKVVTHDRYSFYNVKHHPFLDRGRFLHFEGTYTDFLVKNADTTPRYNYNQILYRLDLDDPRLRLPVPVYRIGTKLVTRAGVDDWTKVEGIAFFAPEAPDGGYEPRPPGEAKEPLVALDDGRRAWRNPLAAAHLEAETSAVK